MNHPARHCMHTAAPGAKRDRCQSGAAQRRVPGMAVLALMLALGLSACTSCGAGTYGGLTGASSCLGCRPGTYAAAPTASTMAVNWDRRGVPIAAVIQG